MTSTSGRSSTHPDGLIAQVYRAEWGRLLAMLVARTRRLDLAEDALSEAFARASDRWPTEGVPANPVGWLHTTAYRLIVGRLRAVLCCHPALARDSQSGLALRLVVGTPTDQIARLFLVSTPTMAARLTRAKQKIAGVGIPLGAPLEDELRSRLDEVCRTIYLAFTAGYSPGTGADLLRADLAFAGGTPGRYPDKVRSLLKRNSTVARSSWRQSGTLRRFAQLKSCAWSGAVPTLLACHSQSPMARPSAVNSNALRPRCGNSSRAPTALSTGWVRAAPSIPNPTATAGRRAGRWRGCDRGARRARADRRADSRHRHAGHRHHRDRDAVDTHRHLGRSLGVGRGRLLLLRVVVSSTAAEVEAVLAALGDPTRRRTFELLAEHGPTTATVLAPMLNISRQAVAKHLVVLADGGLALSERVGRETRYRVVPARLDLVVAWSDRTRALWSRRLDRLGGSDGSR